MIPLEFAKMIVIACHIVPSPQASKQVYKKAMERQSSCVFHTTFCVRQKDLDKSHGEDTEEKSALTTLDILNCISEVKGRT